MSNQTKFKCILGARRLLGKILRQIFKEGLYKSFVLESFVKRA